MEEEGEATALPLAFPSWGPEIQQLPLGLFCTVLWGFFKIFLPFLQ